jgi:septum site-determining protein MinC
MLDLKSAVLTMVAVVLKSPDLATTATELERRFRNTPNLFNNDPVVIDLSMIRDDPAPIDFPGLLALLRTHKMLAVAVKRGNAAQMVAARMAGLAEVPDQVATPAAARPHSPTTTQTTTPIARDVAPPGSPTMVVNKPLRSGQQIYAQGSDLILLAVVNNGAEVIADGHIHVYAPLRGRAIAGARGDTSARIFAQCMEPQLIAIAGYYRTTETPLPDSALGKPAQARLEGEKLVVETLKS